MHSPKGACALRARGRLASDLRGLSNLALCVMWRFTICDRGSQARLAGRALVIARVLTRARLQWRSIFHVPPPSCIMLRSLRRRAHRGRCLRAARRGHAARARLSRAGLQRGWRRGDCAGAYVLRARCLGGTVKVVGAHSNFVLNIVSFRESIAPRRPCARCGSIWVLVSTKCRLCSQYSTWTPVSQ